MAFVHTKMTKHYAFGLAFRLTVFISTFIAYMTGGDAFYQFLKNPLIFNISTFHILWLVFMVTMLSHLISYHELPMSLRKHQKENFVPVENYDQLQLLQQVQSQNMRAWVVMLVWLIFNAIFGLLYLFDIIGNKDLMMLSVFYYLCDYICILFYCPFQSIIMKNKCCVNCRIYDWGHFMMFTPMLFIQNFFSWSLFFMALIVLIHWEIIYACYPERFYEKSNQTLQCKHCKDKTCQAKKKLVQFYHKYK